MVDAAVETLREMDVIALVFDASTRPGRGDEYVSNLLTHVTKPVVLVLNKIDLDTKSALLPLMARAATWHDFAAIVPVSAATEMALTGSSACCWRRCRKAMPSSG